jgi:O-antigen/teichoic acid export membrane protein
MATLKKQAISGMVWTFAEQFGAQFISFIISVVLARLLVPSDFGVIAIFGVVIAIASTIVDGGLVSSLIRTNNPDESDYSTVFIFNIFASFFLYILIYLLAPLISNFYNVSILTPVIRMYGLTVIVNSFVTVQRTHFIKDMNFKVAFKIKMPSLIIGGIFGIVLAYVGFGVWALVYSAVIQSVIFMLQHWFYSKWRPKLVFDKERFKHHFSFGFRMTLSTLLDITFQNLYTVLIGKYFSVQQLGYYNRADSLKQLPVNNISTALNKVSFPLFAKINHDDLKLKEVYRKMMGVVIFIIAPIMSLLVVIAEPLIRLLLTEKWLPSVPYFQILAISGLLYPIHAYNLNILQVKGRSDLFLKLEVIKKTITVILIFFAIRFGIYGLLWGQVILSVIALVINTFYTGKLINYSGLQQISDLLPDIVLAIFSGLCIFLMDRFFLFHLNDFFRLTLLTTLYLILYCGIAFVFNFKEVKFIKELFI